MKHLTRLITAPVIAVLILTATGCGGSSATDATENAAPTQGCTEDTGNEELFTKAKFDCPDDSVVYTFTSSDARNNWRKAADQFGVDVLGQGDTWIKVTR